jgi:hypothetical protein
MISNKIAIVSKNLEITGVLPPNISHRNEIWPLGGGEGSVSCRVCFTSGERAPGTHSIVGWVGPRADLDADE